jgi:hypothetical protein
MERVAVLLLALMVSTSADGAPDFTSGNRLRRPVDYRQWVWLSSGLGMAYGPLSQRQSEADPPFDNVFVNHAAYRAFQQTGMWPDQTIFVLEVRSSISKGSINKGGHFQGSLRGIEVEVKDVKRFGGWAFFGFDGGAEDASAIPRTAGCYSCHAQNGAVDNTFVQFYPTLVDVAKRKRTYRER